MATTQVEPERHRVAGANGCSISPHGEPAGDGRRNMPCTARTATLRLLYGARIPPSGLRASWLRPGALRDDDPLRRRLGSRSIASCAGGRAADGCDAASMPIAAVQISSDKSHRRSSDRLADGCRLVGVVLAALRVGLHVARWHQPYRVAQRLKLTAPMMCGRTCLNTNQAGGQRCGAGGRRPRLSTATRTDQV